MVYQSTEVPSLQDVVDRLQWEGLPIFVGRNLNAAGLLSPTREVDLVDSGTTGVVLLIQKILIATPNSVITVTDDNAVLLQLRDAAGVDQGVLPIHMTSGGDNLDAFVWQPQHPLFIPSGWTLSVYQESLTGDQPHNVMAFGIRIGEDEARTLGYATNLFTADGSKNLIQVGHREQAGGATTELAAIRDGMTIEIMDVVAKLQPDTGPAEMYLQSNDGSAGLKTIFHWYQETAGPGLTQIIKPRIFLAPDTGLDIVTDSACDNRSSVIVIARYVPNDQVPGNAFWNHTNAISYSGNLAGMQIVPTTGVPAPGGEEPVLEGFAWNGAHDAGTGLYANGIIGSLDPDNPLSPLGGTATQLTPTWGLGSVGTAAAHSGSVVMDKINLPVPVLGWGLNFRSQETVSGGIAHNSCTAWGRLQSGTTLDPNQPERSKYMGEG